MPSNQKPYCQTGRFPHPNKRSAEKAADGQPVKRCDRCRQWHVHEKGRRR